jgi:methyltransferase family protein
MKAMAMLSSPTATATRSTGLARTSPAGEDPGHGQPRGLGLGADEDEHAAAVAALGGAAGAAREVDGLDVRAAVDDAADVKDLQDGTFDLAVSIFGAMFCPKPFEVAREMVRVTRLGGGRRDGQLDPQRSDAGRADPEDQLGLLAAAAGQVHRPDDLGHRRQPGRAFTAAAVAKERIVCERDTYVFNFAAPPAELVDSFRRHYGPTMNAFEAAQNSGRGDELAHDLNQCSRARIAATTRARRRSRRPSCA